MGTATKYQAFIDGIQAGQPFEAADKSAAIKHAATYWGAIHCGAGGYLTEHGETLTVVEVAS